jgi:hypothetical protein
VNGTSFVSGATVNFNGSGRLTTFVSATKLAATITAADIASAGWDQVSVSNPAPGGGTSNAVVFAVTSGSNSPTIGTALNFVPVTPCRLVDTRGATGAFGGPSTTGGTSRNLTIPQSPTCNIPPTAANYSLNVAVIPSGPLGFLTLWLAGQTQPGVATMSSIDGRVRSNAAIVPAGACGAISVFASNTTDLVMDINGYFTTATTALEFYPVTPCRVVDTRNADGPLAGPSLAGNTSRTFPLPTSSCNLPSTAQAYSLNLTAVPQIPLGYLTAWLTGQTQPGTANLSSTTGTVTSNAAIVPAGTSGSINVYASNNTDLVIDVDGYFAPAGTGGLSLYNLPPCRVLDTRQLSDTQTTQPFSGELDEDIQASACGVPVGAQAYVLNATVVPSIPLGYLTLWPQGTAQPLAATLSAVDATVTSNQAIVPTSNGSISTFAANNTQLVVDLFGYFAPTVTYTIGGMVSGLSGTGLVLQDNGGNSLTVSANGPFTFTAPLASGTAYSLTVFSQPLNPSQICGAGGSGTVGSANVTSVEVACTNLSTGDIVSPHDYGGIADAITISPVDLSGGGRLLVSAGLFTPDLVGKVVVCMPNNDSQDELNLTTVTGYTDSSHITVAGSIRRAFAGQSCVFASQNFRTALLAAQAAVLLDETLQLPCGNMLISGGQILTTNQFTAAPTGPFNISGCPGMGTHFIMDWATMSTATTEAVFLTGTTNKIADITFDSIGDNTFVRGGSTLDAVVNISGHVEYVEVNDWNSNGPGGTQACFTSAEDGSTWQNIGSGGCHVGLHLFNRASTVIENSLGTIGGDISMIVEGQEDGDVIIGGNYGSPIQVFGNAGNPTTITFMGVNVNGPPSGAALQIGNSTGPLNVHWTGGRIGGQGNGLIQPNSSGVTIGTNVDFRASETRIDSSGTGYGIINSGTFTDGCGNYFTSVGAGVYTGSGVLVGCESPSSFPPCRLGGATGTVSPAECLQAQSGVIAIPALQTTYTVNTNAVTANSQIIVQQTTDNTEIPSATCNPGAIAPMVTSRTIGTSFTISLNSVAAVACFEYTIVD